MGQLVNLEVMGQLVNLEQNVDKISQIEGIITELVELIKSNDHAFNALPWAYLEN